jgi:adenylate cyclase
MNQQDWVTRHHVIMFTDVHNFSLVRDLLGGRSPNFLQEMYQTLGDLILGQGGEIIKYLGDGMLALFPAGAGRAAAGCALGLRRAFAELAGRHGLPPEVDLEVGLTAGEVVVGTAGHPSLRCREVFGRPIDQAAMIGHHRGVAVTQAVHDQLEGAYRTAPLPDLKPRGRTEPLKLCEVKGLL